MANIIIIYGSASIPIDVEPLVNGSINSAFTAKLNEIEAGAFTVSIVSNKVQIEYEGIEIVKVQYNGSYLIAL